MTTSEAPTSQEGEPQANPVQAARRSFNNELLGREYKKVILVPKTIQLQNALLVSDLSPEKIYHELTIVAGQGADRAELFDDSETAATLRVLQAGFNLTYQTFRPRSETHVNTPAQPTRTATLPPMTSPKGGEASAGRGLQAQVQSPAATPANPEPPAPPSQEDTFSSFLKQKRADSKLTQVKLGQAAGGINALKISALENGRQTVDLAGIDQLASALNLSEEDKRKFLELYGRQFPQNPQQ